jgi:ribose transport system substrate-binding protein
MSFLKRALLSLAVTAGLAGIAAAGAQAQDVPSLTGKRIGITVIGTEHYWDLKAYQGQIDEVKRLGGTAIALDAGRNDSRQISQIQTLIAQRPDVIIEQLGDGPVLQPWLKKIRAAGIPLFTVDTISPYSINDTTSDNYGIGEKLALQLASDIKGKGNILVFNGFYSVPVCAIRYDELKLVLRAFPDIHIIQPELRDVIPNTVQNAYSQVTDMLQKYPNKGDIAAVWSAWDVPQVGATQAIVAAHRTEVLTFGVDGSPDVVKMVADPNSPAAAVAAQQPYIIGKTAVDTVARYLAGDHDLPPYTFIPSILVTKQNAADAAKQLGQS